MIDTPAAIVSRAITKKLGFIKELRGSGAVEKNSHFSPRPWHFLRTGNENKMTANVISSIVPIDETTAPDLSTACRPNLTIWSY